MKKSINRYNIFLSLLVVPIVSVFLLTFSVNSLAAAVQTYPLPYCVDYYRSSYFSSGFDYYLNANISPDVRIFSEPFDNNGEVWCRMYVLNFSDITFTLKSHDLNSNKTYYNFDFSNDYLVVDNARYINMVLRSDGYFHQVTSNQQDGSSSNVAFLGKSMGNINQYGFTPMVPYSCKTGSILYNLSDNRQPIIANGNPSDFDHRGHVPRQPHDQDPDYSSGDSAPIDVPILSNFQNSDNFLAKTIQYYGNLINSQLNDIKNDIYDNFLPLIVTFSVLYNYGLDDNGNFSIPVLTSTLFLPAPEDVQYLMETNDTLHVASSIDIIVDKIYRSETSVIKTLHNVVPSPTFHIPSCTYHGKEIGNFDIDFSWFARYKSYSDVIVGSFLWIGWIYWFFVSVSHLIRFGKCYEYDETSVGGDKGWGIRF